MTNEIVPFGKYKNQPVAAMAQDRSYCEWLLAQDWFVQRFPGIRTLVINNFQEPTDTPEHNALQLRFLSEDMRARVLHVLLKRGMRYGARHDNGRAIAPIPKDTHFFSRTSKPVFEINSIDVFWEAFLWGVVCQGTPKRSYINSLKESDYVMSYEWGEIGVNILIECKPSLGDDYPSVLRSIKTLNVPPTHNTRAYAVLLCDKLSFAGGSYEQVVEFFSCADVFLVTLQEVLDVPPMTSFPKDMLPANPVDFYDRTQAWFYP